MAHDLLSRDEVLGGLPAKRASALLYLIESRTAQLVARARHTMVPFRSEDAARERELAYVEAFALGRAPPNRPTIQDLELHAPQWADLVPANPRLRAAVARQLGQKYQFAAADVPSMRAALGLDDPAVQGAYERLHGEPLDSIYRRSRSPVARLRWAGAALSGWVDSLSPFWTAFALTLTETVGAGILALPIALAGVGPLPGIALLIVLGVVNVLTISWMAESAVRTASVRYGGAYFGRFVTEYLGSASSVLLIFALVVNCAALWIAYAIGLASTLSSATGIAAGLWVAVLFVVVIYMISRDSLSSTVASALGFGAINLLLIGSLALLGFVRIDPDNLSRVEVPGLGDTPFELSFIGLIFGVILISYFGHTSVGNCAAIVLQRDPSGKSLIRGAASAQIVAIVVYSIWVLAINGAIAPGALQGHTGTALDPLADVVGRGVYVVGAVFVVLAMGMGAIHQGLGLVNVVRERLPRRAQPIVLLPRRGGRLLFSPRGRSDDRGPRLILTYLGRAGDQPRYRLQVQVGETLQRVNHTGSEPWLAVDVLETGTAEDLDAIDLRIETIDADDDRARVCARSTMRMTYEGPWAVAGLDLAGLLDADDDAPADPDSALMQWILRQGEVDVAEAAAWLGDSEDKTRERLHEMAERGALREVRQGRAVAYRAVVARRRARSLPEGMAAETSSQPSRAARTEAARDAAQHLLEGRARVAIEYAPVLVVFLLTEWLVLSERGSFAVLLSFSGAIAVPIFAGIFPVMLLQASRRKGDLVPSPVSRLLGQPWLAIAVYALFVLGILLHGLLIWQQPGERVAAIVAGLLTLLITIVAIRRGAFDRRTVVMLRDDQRPGGTASFEVVSSGQRTPVETAVRRGDGVDHVRAATIDVPDIAALREISAELPADRSRDLKVWANRITPQGDTESLPAHARLTSGDDSQDVDLRVAGGEVLLTRADESGLAITFDAPPAEAGSARAGRKPRRGKVDLDSLLSDTTDTNAIPAKGD